jgi:hypothetical protein
MRSSHAFAAPRVASVLHLGGEREEWDRIFDEAVSFRHDDATLRLLENMERQDEYERKLPYIPIASRSRERARGRLSGGGPATLAALFRRGFYANIGGTPGVSDALFDAGYYNVDGGTGKVGSFIDYIDTTHLLAQAVSGSQVAIPTNNAAFASAKGGSFLGGTIDGVPDHYVSNRAASAFSYIISGNGCDVSLTMSPTSITGLSIYLCTISNSVVNGIQLYASSDSAVCGYWAGSSANVTVSTALAVGVGKHHRFSFVGADTPRLNYLLNGVNVGSASPLTTASDGERPLTLGARDGGSSPGLFDFRQVALHQRKLTNAERAVEAAYTTATTGIAVTP